MWEAPKLCLPNLPLKIFLKGPGGQSVIYLLCSAEVIQTFNTASIRKPAMDSVVSGWPALQSRLHTSEALSSKGTAIAQCLNSNTPKAWIPRFAASFLFVLLKQIPLWFDSSIPLLMHIKIRWKCSHKNFKDKWKTRPQVKQLKKKVWPNSFFFSSSFFKLPRFCTFILNHGSKNKGKVFIYSLSECVYPGRAQCHRC